MRVKIWKYIYASLALSLIADVLTNVFKKRSVSKTVVRFSYVKLARQPVFEASNSEAVVWQIHSLMPAVLYFGNNEIHSFCPKAGDKPIIIAPLTGSISI